MTPDGCQRDDQQFEKRKRRPRSPPDSRCYPPLRGYAAPFRQGRDLANALDGARVADDAAVTSLCPARTVFSRFITPARADEAPGQWQSYYRRWAKATRENLEPAQLDLVSDLACYAPPATIIDQPAYSAFYRSFLADFLTERHGRTLIVSGAETDVCVLSTVLDAVNTGYRVVILQDCLCSSSDEGHDALMTIYRLRYTQQIDLITADMLPEIWMDLAR